MAQRFGSSRRSRGSFERGIARVPTGDVRDGLLSIYMPTPHGAAETTA